MVRSSGTGLDAERAATRCNDLRGLFLQLQNRPRRSPNCQCSQSANSRERRRSLVTVCYNLLAMFGGRVMQFTLVQFILRLEARAGIEPAHRGFADLGLTTWLPRHHCAERDLLRRSGDGPQGNLGQLVHGAKGHAGPAVGAPHLGRVPPWGKREKEFRVRGSGLKRRQGNDRRRRA